MAPRKLISTLFLDVGGVLLTNAWNHPIRELAAATFKLDSKEMETRHHLTFDTYEAGKLSLDDYLDRIIFYETRNFSKQDFKKFMFEQSKSYPQMIDMVCNLKKKYSLKIAVINNEGRELNEYRIKKFKLEAFVDFFISSCYVHLRKPDEDIFCLALDIAHVPPHQAIYIDDRLMFVQVASTLKIQGIHHDNFDSTCTELADFGLKI